MRILSFSVLLIFLIMACNSGKNPNSFIKDKDIVKACKLIYSSNIFAAYKDSLPTLETIFIPQSQKGNLAVLLKEKGTENYALVIRGTLLRFEGDGLINIIQDANVLQMKAWSHVDTTAKAYVAGGVFEAFENILQLQDTKSQKDLMSVLQSLPANASLVIAGHSLGGNIANLVASYLHSKIKLPMQLVTFGAPASGDIVFTNDLEKKYPHGKRYVIENDVATLFPDINSFKKGANAIGITDSVIAAQIATEKNIKYKLLLGLSSLVLDALDNTNFKSPYIQSKKMERKIMLPQTQIKKNVIDVFENAYYYHNVNNYVKMVH